LKIQQAVYGPFKGHAFLAGSEAASEPSFRNAAWATDLPQTSPPGVTWNAFFRLIQVDEHFVFTYTRPFNGGSRAGMVFSRAAFIPLIDLPRLNDLRPIARVLEQQWVQDDLLGPILVEDEQPVLLSRRPSRLVVQIASAISDGVEKPLVVAGQHGFDDAMFDLWARVPSEFRTQITFSLSFGPEDARTTSILCAPEVLVGQWEPNHRIEELDAPIVSGQTAVFLGVTEGEHVRAFAREIGLALNSVLNITIALTAQQLWKSGVNAADAIRLLRIISEKANSEPRSTDIKAAVISRLVALKSEWGTSDVLAMRNVDVSSFPNASELSTALQAWATDVQQRAKEKEERTILQLWAEERAKPLWISAIGRGLFAAFESAGADDAHFFELWAVLTSSPSRANSLLNLLASTKEPERRMLNTLPATLSAINVDLMLSDFIHLRWWELAGRSLSSTRTPLEALQKALTIKAGSSKTLLITAALNAATDRETVNAAMATLDPVALQLAAAALIRTPSIINSFGWCNPAWYKMLAIALQSEGTLLDSLPDPISGMETMLQAGITDASIWEVISMTKIADLTTIPSRALAWDLIPDAYMASVLAATAQGWLSSFELGQRTSSELEPRLAEVVRELAASRGFLVQVLQRAPSAFPLYLRDFVISSDSDATLLLLDLQQSQVQLSELAACGIGQLIQSNHWISAADQARKMLSSRGDVRPLLAECLKQLGLLDRIRVAFKLNSELQISADEAWTAFESEATSLYSWGPETEQLWSRSGGHNQDLAREGTGKEKWHRCVHDLRAGKAPGVLAVLYVMQRDYPGNDTLKALSRHDLLN
jgi:hypothetical protein